MTTKEKQSGFTLIEILVAVLILGIIFSFIFGVLTASLTSKEAKARMGINHTGRFFINRVSADLSCATLLPLSATGKMVGRHYKKSGKSRDEIHFTAFTQSYYSVHPPTDQSEIGYYFRTGKNGVETLMRREADLVESPVELGGQAFELSPLVEELSIRYKKDDTWVEEWDTSISHALPVEISVELTINDGKRKYLFTSIVKPMV
jgi:prepilin-type N-terminal cleavage/methylation domain-containing protein